jgi:SAM-dependent methyltransferase
VTGTPSKAATRRTPAALASALADRLAGNPLAFHYLRKLPEFNYQATKARIRRVLGRSGAVRVLDLGCGTGEFAALFEPAGYVGVDIHPGYVRLATRLHPKHRFVCADARDWPGQDTPFDLSMVNGVLHHLDDETARALLGTAVRHARPGGTLLVIEDVELPGGSGATALVHALDQGAHIRNADEWLRLVGEVFTVEENESYRSGVCPYLLMLGRKA